ncbi:hypothetical protein EZJ55_10200 [Microcystis aeruginosa EAWAG127a]|uniref:Uncharacterized protein n=1 Tax=Microcystis aeruginosa EAWAG127a TaxID=2529855 RepID=A0A5J5LT41_MICAE|nr:hypothetical protein EZJ55_10200 [Microcystis aeruginosa EAWAG127a]
MIRTPLIKGGSRGDPHPPYQGGSPRLSAPPLSRGAGGIRTSLIKGDPPAYRHPPYQGGQGGSIFNLIITTYLSHSNCSSFFH